MDVARSSALIQWSNHLDRAVEAVYSLRVATLTCQLDLQLADQGLHQSPWNSDNRVSSLEDMVAFMNDSSVKLEQLLADASIATAFANRFQNASRHLVPIHRLPVELLREIFIYAIESEEPPDDRTCADMPGSVWFEERCSISLVCRHWRDIAISTGRLWKFIDFNDYQEFNITPILIERAQNFGLDIFFDAYTISHPDCHDGWWDCANMIIPHFPHWRHLTFFGRKVWLAELLERVEKPLENNITSLRIDDTDRGGENRSLDPFWNSLTQLKVLTLSEYPIPIHIPAMPAILRGLLHLRLWRTKYQPKGDLYIIFSGCPNLISLSLEEYNSDRVNNHNPPPLKLPVTLPALSSIKIVGMAPHWVQYTFSSITVPSLVTLIIDHMSSLAALELNEFVDRSRPVLRTLDIGLWEKDTYDIVEPTSWVSQLVATLRLMPSLETFILRDGSSAKAQWSILDALTATPDCICPRLQHLEFNSVLELSLLKLHDMVQSRGTMVYEFQQSKELRPLDVLVVGSCLPSSADLGRPYADWIRMEKAVRDCVMQVTWNWVTHGRKIS